MIKYSIIIPCYNITPYLKKCLNSIWQNVTKEVEVVIVDDGSQDDFQTTVEEFFCVKLKEEITIFEYKNAKVLISRQENKGVSETRNKGIELATGKWILFIDPDDYIAKNTIALIDEIIMQKQEFDMLIMGFNRCYEDKNGRVIGIEKIIPKELYDINSNKEAVEVLLPKYLGYSVEHMRIWGRKGISLPLQVEFGTVWRNVYNRRFLVENDIRFKKDIKLNEDGMFNANCIACATRIVSSNESFYYYTIRATGALSKNRGLLLATNKLHLLEERNKIIHCLKEKGYGYSVRDYAGSNVMSAIELMFKCSLGNRGKVNEYIHHPLVHESICIMPRIGIKKVDIPVMMLKFGLSDLLYLLIRVAKKFGVRLSI